MRKELGTLRQKQKELTQVLMEQESVSEKKKWPRTCQKEQKEKQYRKQHEQDPRSKFLDELNLRIGNFNQKFGEFRD